MQTTKIEIQIIKKDIYSSVDPSTLSNVIFVEDNLDLHIVSQITLSGQYNRIYNVVSFLIALDSSRAFVNDDKLLICLFEELAIVDLKQDKLARVINFNDCWGIRNFCKFKSGYFIHGEGANYFLNKDCDILWEARSIDIFANPKVENDFELHEDYIVVYDWYGHKFYYNEHGEFNCEYCPKFDCNLNN